MAKRVFLIVLDSFGIGGAPDAADFGDEEKRDENRGNVHDHDAVQPGRREALFAVQDFLLLISKTHIIELNNM